MSPRSSFITAHDDPATRARAARLGAAVYLPKPFAGRATQTPKSASPAADSGFSFAANGDSRTMMYLPYRQDQEAEARRLMTELWSLQLAPKAAAEAVRKSIKFTYDPQAREMVEMTMPFMSAGEVMYASSTCGPANTTIASLRRGVPLGQPTKSR